MKKTRKLISIIISISLLCSCARMTNPQDETNSTTQLENNENATKEESTTEIVIVPVGNESEEKKAHSYGVAKDGKPHDISVNVQKYFDSKSFKALCLDTKTDRKIMYLTFDCGYENGYTSTILDVLKEKNVTAAFFCTLPQVKENPELIARMINEGHIVGNHSVNHPSFAEITIESMEQEIKGMEEYLKENYNYSEPYFRFPKGEYTDKALRVVENLGYTSVFWSVAYADWDLNNQKGEQYAFNTVVSRFHPGAVILLHSVSPDNAHALGKIIDEARRQGYEFCSLREYS